MTPNGICPIAAATLVAVLSAGFSGDDADPPSGNTGALVTSCENRFSGLCGLEALYS